MVGSGFNHTSIILQSGSGYGSCVVFVLIVVVLVVDGVVFKVVVDGVVLLEVVDVALQPAIALGRHFCKIYLHCNKDVIFGEQQILVNFIEF